MMKKWRDLSNLACVKEYGLMHQLAHFLGIYYVSRCFMSFGKFYAEGLAKGIEEDGSKEA